MKEEHEVQLSASTIRKVMRKEMRLGYRKARTVTIQCNSERCLVMRQQYALAMLSALDSGKRIINVDETWLNETNFTRKTWCLPESRGSVPQRVISPSLSMIAALDTDGRVFFALSHATTNQDTFMVFMRHLVAKLDQETPGWQENSIILVDNAPYHTGDDISNYLRKMQVPIMYSGPYSYSAAPIESLFSLLKWGELNKARQSAGKK